MEYNRSMEWFHTGWKSLITKAVMGTTSTDDDIVMYVKGHEKREGLRDLLLDDARRAVYVENIEAHYEDIESLNKLNVTHTLRCQKHVKNCLRFTKCIQNIQLVASTSSKIKQMLFTCNVSILFFIPFSQLHINYLIIAIIPIIYT